VCPVTDNWYLAPLLSGSEGHLQQQIVSDVCRQSSDDVRTADARFLTSVRGSGFTPDGHLVDSNSGPLTRDSGFMPDGHPVDSNSGPLTRDSGFTPDGHPVDSNSGPLTRDSGFTPDGHPVESNAPLPRIYAKRPPSRSDVRLTCVRTCLTSVGCARQPADGARRYKTASKLYSTI